MFRACHLDVADDFTTTQANCRLEATRSDQAACERTAREDLQAARGGCREQWSGRRETCDVLAENRYIDPIADPAVRFVHPDDVGTTYEPNPYVSVLSGKTLLLRAGENFNESVVIHVTDEVREVQGVACRVVWDLVLESSVNDAGDVEYEAVEVTEDWFAQSEAGDIYYCGEAVRDYEDGIVIDISGSFEAGTGFAHGGFLTKAYPVIGSGHRQELDLGNAEDVVQYLDIAAVPTDDEGGENPSFSCAPQGCLRTFDFAPLSPGSTEYKYYLAGTGLVTAVHLTDGMLTGERDELVCTGESLDILETPACGLANAAALRETICELVPDALCD